jgi:hypothetical protein
MLPSSVAVAVRSHSKSAKYVKNENTKQINKFKKTFFSVIKHYDRNLQKNYPKIIKN